MRAQENSPYSYDGTDGSSGASPTGDTCLIDLAQSYFEGKVLQSPASACEIDTSASDSIMKGIDDPMQSRRYKSLKKKYNLVSGLFFPSPRLSSIRLQNKTILFFLIAETGELVCIREREVRNRALFWSTNKNTNASPVTGELDKIFQEPVYLKGVQDCRYFNGRT